MRHNVTCPYCTKGAVKVDGRVIYPHRPDLHDKWFWYCADCGAWVGCHPYTSKPLGRLANAELRQLKMAAHRAFDPIWKLGLMSRHDAYKWLSDCMELPRSLTHIGMFDEAQCREVVHHCNNREGL